jgi:hypothetical protein
MRRCLAPASTVARNAEYLIRVGVGRWPALLALQAARPSRWRQIARAQSVACIEGFPRSANSYAIEVFWRRNGQLPLAHHLHVPGQVLRAVELRRPCVVLVRRPLDALSSLLIIDERLTVGLAVWSYIDFYRRAWPTRDAVVVCEFEEVIADASIVSRRLNERFHTRFDDRPIDEAERDEALRSLEDFHRVQGHTRWLLTTPHPEKERLKAEVREALKANRRLAEAERWFDRWAQRAGA